MDQDNVIVTEGDQEGRPGPVAQPEVPEHHHRHQRGFIAEWTVTIILLLFGTTSLIQAYVIPTGSMEDTLLVGDHLLVDKLAYAPAGGSISSRLLPYTGLQRGDIIVFRYPVDIRQTFVKRCIGIPGDHLRLVNKQLYLNGRFVEEPYVYHKTDYFDPYRDDFPLPNIRSYSDARDMMEHHVDNGELVVPPDSYFAMGDNRDSSLDSRYWGFVPRANIIGKPLIIYWSYEAPSDQLQDPSIGINHILDIGQHFFTKTRWSRTFRLIHGYAGN